MTDSREPEGRQLAAKSFNEVWSLLDQPPTPARDAALRNAAHASRYLWGLVGWPENRARGDWLLAPMYLA